jgi:hypothetical protein
MNTIEKCRCCDIDIDITVPRGYAKWTVADPSINLDVPPADISGAFVCDACYVDGPTLEVRIRAHDIGNPAVSAAINTQQVITQTAKEITTPINSGSFVSGSIIAAKPEPIYIKPELAGPAREQKPEVDYWSQPYPIPGRRMR